MCGIVGYIGPKSAIPVLFDGLQRLEYRGYDSAGVAVITADQLEIFKRAGCVSQLITDSPDLTSSTVGIGHTRWATHGEPNQRNAHPHTDSAMNIAVVHNGIIENASHLRATVLKDVTWSSDTDTEVLAHLIAAQPGPSLEQAVRQALLLIEGSYAIAVVDRRHPDRIVVARNGSPVLIGVGQNEHFIASDLTAIIPHTDQVVYLDDREIAVLHPNSFSTFTLESSPTTKHVSITSTTPAAYDHAGHPDFMHKEIHQQPISIASTMRGRIDYSNSSASLENIDLSPSALCNIRQIKLLGCGTAFYAALAGAQLLENLTHLPATAEPASEFRYRSPLISPDTLYIIISQSGETYDTLAALREIKSRDAALIAIVNTPDSTIPRESNSTIYLNCGPEISVASTKTFISTLAAFTLLGIYLGRQLNLPASDASRILRALERIPSQISEILNSEQTIADAASLLTSAKSAFFIGRVASYPIALEGAQKMKEITYIHAEAYPTAELKHGPLALISTDLPTVAIVPDDRLWDKNMGSLSEIAARSGPLLVVTDSPRSIPATTAILKVPSSEPELTPLLHTIPLQLLAYHTARALGRDIDKPRNLAKSVTVE